MVSKCCKYTMRVEGGGGHGDTMYYVCNKCDNATDPKVSFLWDEIMEKEIENALV